MVIHLGSPYFANLSNCFFSLGLESIADELKVTPFGNFMNGVLKGGWNFNMSRNYIKLANTLVIKANLWCLGFNHQVIIKDRIFVL